MDSILKLLTEIRPDSNFVESGNFIEDYLFDSFDIMELTVLLEKKYEIRIDISDIIPENYKDIPSIIAMVTRQGGKVDE